jgi:hypothetical protein
MAANFGHLVATGRGGARFINLEAIDEDFDRKGQVLGTPTDRKRTYLGQDSIGPIGIALALHRYLWHLKRMSAGEFGRALNEQLKIAMSELPQFLTPDHLACWVQPSRPVALPDEEIAPLILGALEQLAKIENLDGGAIGALRAPWRRPSELLTRLMTNREVRQVGQGPEFLRVDPTLLSIKAPKADPKVENLALQLRDLLGGDVGANQIIVLAGQRYSGKRRTIARLLEMKRAGEPPVMELSSGGYLPLFARNVAVNALEEVVRDIARFLGASAEGDLDAIIPRIEEKAKGENNRAIYILTEVPVSTDPLGRLLSCSQLLQRLIGAIFRPGGGNRLLLTAAEVDIEWIQHYNLCQLKMPAPSLRDIASRYDLAWPNEGEIRDEDGPFSTLLETLLSERWDNDDRDKSQRQRIAEKALRERASREPAGSKDDDLAWFSRRDDLMTLAKGIREQVKQEGALEALMFVAASEDGLRLSSLKRLYSKRQKSEQDAERDRTLLLERLPYICREIEWEGPWPNEDAPWKDTCSEPWLELLPPFRRVFERCFLREDETEFRSFTAMIADLVWERYRWMRMNPQKRHDQGALGRGFQALRAGQIALDPRGIAPKRNEPLMDTSMCFPGTVGDARRAFQFLYFDLFRDDLDVDYRLSLRYQRDDLRLNLLMGFCHLGAPVYMDEISTENCFRSWDFVVKILSEEEQARLLVSIAVAAKRAGAWAILDATVIRAQDLEDKGFLTIQRVFRCEVDAALLRCGAQASTMPTLASIKELVNTRISDLEKRLTDPEPGMHDRWLLCYALCKMRLRLAEVQMLEGELDTAMKTFDEIFSEAQKFELDENRSPVRDVVRRREWRRSPFVGYGARRYLRLLCMKAGKSHDQGERRRLLERAQSLLDLNLRRISKFEGEALGLTLDQAQIVCVEQPDDLYGMLKKMPEPQSIMPLATRLDTDAIFARLAIDLLAGGGLGEDGARLYERAESVTHRLVHTARIADLLPYRALGELLAARLLALPRPPGSEHSHQTHQIDGRPRSELLQSSKSIAAKIGLASVTTEAKEFEVNT